MIENQCAQLDGHYLGLETFSRWFQPFLCAIFADPAALSVRLFLTI
jgi:hypothetical protein